MQLDVAVLSERGGRNENQDACDYWQSPDAAFFVLCDGAGGHLGGSVAAKVAVSEALRGLREQGRCDGDAVEAAMKRANNAVVREQQAQTQYAHMRATIVALAVDVARCTAAWGHLGDSRLYCFRQQRVIAQTRDHSVVQSLVDAGYLDVQQLRTSPDRSKLLSALGDPERFEPAIQRPPLTLSVGDCFLLCTDGLWEYVEDAEMEQLLASTDSAQTWLRELEGHVKARGKRRHDNYSAVAVWCTG